MARYIEPGGPVINEKLLCLRLDNTAVRPVFQPRMFGRIQYRNYISMPHRHAFYHLILISRGRCYLELDARQRFLLAENTLLLINPNVPHAFSQVGQEPVEHTGLLWQLLNPTDQPVDTPLQQLVDGNRREDFLFAQLNHLEVTEILMQYRALQALLRPYQAEKPFSPAAFALIMRLLQLLINRTKPLDTQPETTALLRQIELLADDFLADPGFGLKEIARRFQRTPHHLSRQFKECCGYTIPEYLTWMRMLRAEQLLLTTRQPVSEIARQCGYSTASYLAKVFIRHFGSAPLTYRRTAVSRPGPLTWGTPRPEGEKSYYGALPLVGN